MAKSSGETLTPHDAARQIFNVAKPTEQQVSTVLGLIKSGVLRKASAEHWNTTVSAVAQYLAQQESQRLHARKDARSHSGAKIGPDGKPLSRFYEDVLREYFMAVLLQRRSTEYSGVFYWAVIATQAITLFLGVVVIVAIIYQAARLPFVSPQHAAVKKWLQNRHDIMEVSEIKPAPGVPNALQVKFTYREGGRIVQSQLHLTMSGNEVAGISSTAD
jgi:hypothetical protein